MTDSPPTQHARQHLVLPLHPTTTATHCGACGSRNTSAPNGSSPGSSWCDNGALHEGDTASLVPVLGRTGRVSDAERHPACLAAALPHVTIGECDRGLDRYDLLVVEDDDGTTRRFEHVAVHGHGGPFHGDAGSLRMMLGRLARLNEKGLVQVYTRSDRHGDVMVGVVAARVVVLAHYGRER